MNSGRSLIKLSCICFVCLPVLAVKAAASTNKTTKTMQMSTQLDRQSSVLLSRCEVSVGWNIALDLASPILFDLWNHIFNNWQVEYNSTLIVKHAKWESILPKNHLLESISTPLKCQDLYFQIHYAFFFSFISWRYPAKTAGFCHSASLNVFIFTPNVRRVEIFWLRKTDSCSSTVHSILPSLKKT